LVSHRRSLGLRTLHLHPEGKLEVSARNGPLLCRSMGVEEAYWEELTLEANPL